MIIDSSAIVAILLLETDAARFAVRIESATVKFIATPTYLEICMVVAGRRPDRAANRVEAFIREAEIEMRAFSNAAAHVAVKAFLTYGKGRHRAGMNFGDCISYAMAKTEAMPLLFKGDDFRLTDVEPAL